MLCDNTNGIYIKEIKAENGKDTFCPTGALLSKVSFNEGNTVPGIAHGVLLKWNKIKEYWK